MSDDFQGVVTRMGKEGYQVCEGSGDGDARSEGVVWRDDQVMSSEPLGVSVKIQASTSSPNS